MISPLSLPESGYYGQHELDQTLQRCMAMSIQDTRIAIVRFPGGLAAHGLV